MTLVCGDTYDITYTNADGLSTERKISVEDQWESWGYEYIKAYCHLKEEVRTFRIDRIQRAEAENRRSLPLEAYFRPCTGGSAAPAVAACSPAAAPQSSAPAALSPATAPHPPIPTPARQQEKPDYRTGPHPLTLTMSCLFILAAAVTCISGNLENRRAPVTVAAKSAREKPVQRAPVKTAEWENQIAQRTQRYSLATGFRSAALTGIYASADLNYDNILSWQEIDRFQRQLKSKFRYQNNQTALTPEDFLKYGGGDCEDWALFTCGLLRFWGYKAYVGVIDGGDGRYSGHAIALFYKKTRPANAGFSWYNITDPHTFSNVVLQPGYYLPIDYEYSGSFSNASRPDSPLRYVYVPEEIYNRYM